MGQVLLDLAEPRVVRRAQRLDLSLDRGLCRGLLSHFRCGYFDFALGALTPTLAPRRVQSRAARCSLIGRRSGSLCSSPLRLHARRSAMPLPDITRAAQSHLRGAVPALQQSPSQLGHALLKGASISGRRLSGQAHRFLVPALRGRR
jgi:hypothetical protein